jgi:Tol biopolymer transport system component
MTSDRRFERDLPDLLAELAPRAMPDYRDDIVRQTARMRQRPAWTFPERWLPESVISTRASAAPPIRWRVVGVVALLLALAVGLAVIAGSRPKVPAPFGPAANGLVAYEAGGDILTADPVTGVAKALVTGTQMDLRPVFSRDGTHFVFERTTGLYEPGRLIVARSDGTDPVVVTREPVAGLDPGPEGSAQYTFSPDGTEIALWSRPDAGSKLWIAKSDGSGMRPANLSITVGEAAYRPPNGAELIVASSQNGGANGIYAFDAQTGVPRTIVAPVAGVGVGFVRVSPDGSRLAYSSGAADGGPSSYRVHVIGLDGRNDVTLPLPTGAVFQDAPAWSNDGTRLAITRGYAQHNEDMALAVLPADGSGVGVESAHGLTGCCNTILQWSPDDTSILVMPEAIVDAAEPMTVQHLLLDPLTGVTTPAPWTGSSPPAWQRTVR